MPTIKTRNDELKPLTTIDCEEIDSEDESTELKIPSSSSGSSWLSSSTSSSSASSDDLDGVQFQHIQTDLRDFHTALHSSPSSFLAEMNSLVRDSFPTFYLSSSLLPSSCTLERMLTATWHCCWRCSTTFFNTNTTKGTLT